MSYRIPTILQLYNAHLALLESALNQNSPDNEKSFIKVLAKTEAGQDIGLYKFAADAVLQTLALTATGSGLDTIGNNWNTPRKQEQVAILEATLPSTTGTVIAATTDFTGDANGIRYRPETDVTAVAGVATLSLRATEPGTDGNLDPTDTLSIGEQIAGAETVATVVSTTQIGVNEETDADYRPRVLFAQRAVTGGGNATDHKIWAEAVTGVRRGFPYAGRPASEGTSFPADRTVYVESTTTIDADGIAPQSLLDDVRDSINTDPLTGKSRSTLGLTDDTLFVESIIRTSIFVEIRDLVVSAEKESELKSSIDTALDLYFRTIAMFVDGVDVPQERTDSITNTSVSAVIQDVLFSFGATAQTIGFGLVVGVFIPMYLLNMGELTKLGGTAYA